MRGFNRSGRAFGLILVLAMAGSGCVSGPKQYVSKLDPLAIQQMQTEEFEGQKGLVFASALATFQDLGFVIATADVDTGLITAKSATQSSRDWIWTGATTDLTVNVSAFVEEARPGVTKVRVNLVESTKRENFYGGGGTDEIPIEKPETYEKLFAKIREAVFVRKAHAK
ncbi:MAG: hypothetical protein RL527_2078 [Planctomycetota bacterium]|jgi:hypothetical protein